MSRTRNDVSRMARRIFRANENAEAREARTDEEQLQILEANGHGKCKEANRLRVRIGLK